MHEKTSWQEDTALERYQMITPLLDDDIDEAERLRRRKKISEDNGISERTLYRYEKSYRESGFTGLKPADRTKLRSKKLPENFDELLSEAIQLKREVPKRSVSMIIDILEMEKRVAPGVLKRSTLQDHLFAAGYGRKQMNQYVEARNSSSKRFCKPHRMMLVQGDIKYGIYLPIGRHGAKRRTYLSSAIDDHSRYILYSHYYDSQEGSVVEDTFRHVIQDYGAFDKAYFDNGHQYTARQLKFTLARLGIKVSWAPVRSGKSKGKIEKFHQVVDAFQREADLKKLKTLDELNRLWDIYLEDAYQNDAHDGIREYYESLNCPVPEEGITPQQEFNRDTRALTFLDVTTVAEAFLHHEERLVDKGACISFQGRKYETKPSLIGYKVGISYDPAAPEKITVTHPTTGAFTAEPLKIGSFCDKSPTLPVSMQEAKPETSRYLDVLEKKHQENRQLFAVVTSDPGCGKSTLIRKFAAGLDSNRYIFIYLSDSKLTPRWMYKGMLDQLGLESRFYRGDSKRQLQKQIEIIRKVDHKKVVCVLDEAHLLEKETIEEFRFLLNYHFDSMSPMALVLCGQTELWDEKLKLNRYAAVRQRIDMYCTLPHLTREETEEYIRSNLDYSGCGHEIFTSGAVSLIYDFSNGIMRVIDHLCSKSLMYAFQQQKHLIDDHMIRFVNDHEMITVGKAVS